MGCSEMKVLNRTWVALIMYLRGFIYGAGTIFLFLLGFKKILIGFYLGSVIITCFWFFLFGKMDEKAKVQK